MITDRNHPANTRPLRNRLGRAARWVDTWTLEAFNPVYPYRAAAKASRPADRRP